MRSFAVSGPRGDDDNSNNNVDDNDNSSKKPQQFIEKVYPKTSPCPSPSDSHLLNGGDDDKRILIVWRKATQ